MTPSPVDDWAQELYKNVLQPKTSGPKFRCSLISLTITTWSVQPTGGSFPAIRLTENVSWKEMKRVGRMKYGATTKNDFEISWTDYEEKQFSL